MPEPLWWILVAAYFVGFFFTLGFDARVNRGQPWSLSSVGVTLFICWFWPCIWLFIAGYRAARRLEPPDA